MFTLTRFQLLFAFFLLFGCAPARRAESVEGRGLPAETTVLLVRHAEKQSGDDPPLSSAGQTRARDLASKLEGRNIDAIYVTPTRRTRATARPLADARELTIHEHEQNAAFARYLLKEHAGQTVLVVGHRTTVPVMLDAFEGTDGRDVLPNVYHQLFVVTVDDNGAAKIAVESFGQR